eukprot:3313808-Alexandrium_andersonii.AAC.1
MVDEQLGIPGERLPDEEAVLLGRNVSRGDPLIKLTTVRPPSALRILAIPLRRRALVEVLAGGGLAGGCSGQTPGAVR